MNLKSWEIFTPTLNSLMENENISRSILRNRNAVCSVFGTYRENTRALNSFKERA